MKLSLDENGHAVLDEGKPVYVNDDGTKVAADVPAAFAKIKELNGESAKHRTDANQYKSDFEAYKTGYGEVTPEQALAAIEAVKNHNDNDFVPKSQFESRVNELTLAHDTYKDEADLKLSTEIRGREDADLGRMIADAKFLKEVHMTNDAALALYKGNFKFENGIPFGIDTQGNKILSDVSVGNPASVDECLQKFIMARPDINQILKSNHGGSGSGGGNNNNNGQSSPKTTQEKIRAGLLAMQN